MKETILLLKRHQVGVEDAQIGEPPQNLMDFLSNAPMQWDQLVNAAFKKREDIVSFQNSEADSVVKNSDKFETRVTKERKVFRENAPFDVVDVKDSREVNKAYDNMIKWSTTLLNLQNDAQSLNNLEDLFEGKLKIQNLKFKECSHCARHCAHHNTCNYCSKNFYLFIFLLLQSLYSYLSNIPKISALLTFFLKLHLSFFLFHF